MTTIPFSHFQSHFTNEPGKTSNAWSAIWGMHDLHNSVKALHCEEVTKDIVKVVNSDDLGRTFGILRTTLVQSLILRIYLLAYSSERPRYSAISADLLRKHHDEAVKFHTETYINKQPEKIEETVETHEYGTFFYSVGSDRSEAERLTHEWLEKSIIDMAAADSVINHYKEHIEYQYKSLLSLDARQIKKEEDKDHVMTFSQLAILVDAITRRFQSAALFYTLAGWGDDNFGKDLIDEYGRLYKIASVSK